MSIVTNMGSGSSKSITLPDMKLKMVLIGSGGSGKTSVFSRITSNQVFISVLPCEQLNLFYFLGKTIQ